MPPHTALPWYHGSQQLLTALRPGSSITQNPAIARAFSHRPSLVSMGDDGAIKHNGATPGYLYLVSEEVRPGDCYPHPHPVNVSRWECLTTRQLQLRLVEHTSVREEDRLTGDEIAEIRRKQREAGENTFAR